jgi:hypothetical protein
MWIQQAGRTNRAARTEIVVSAEYIMGIQEGREIADKYGVVDAADRLDNLNRTIKGFAANTPVGQMLRGERDFWRNQVKIANKEL